MPTVSKRVFLLGEQLREKVPGGIGVHTMAILRSLSKIAPTLSDFEFEIVATRPQGADPLADLGLPLRYLSLPHGVFRRLSDLNFPTLGERGGIYHSFSMFVPPVNASDQKRVVTVHDLAFISNPSFFTKRGARWHTKQLERLKHLSCPIVVVSDQTQQALTRWGVDPQRIRVIQSGSDHLAVPDRETASELLSSKGITGPFIMSVSTLEPRKNLRGLIQGFKVAQQVYADPLNLVVVGPRGWGNDHSEVNGVHFLGSVPDGVLSALYEKASALVYVPFEEGFGLPVIEAMAMGLPVVSSGVPAAGGATYLVDPDDHTSIGTGVIEVLNDTKLRLRLVEEGLRRAGSNTWEDSVRNLIELWRSI